MKQNNQSGEQPHAANVELLTAEVRVLMVGSRQITLSVFRQLDWIPPQEIVPFGRITDPRDSKHAGDPERLFVTVVGKGKAGQLARSRIDELTRPEWEEARATCRRSLADEQEQQGWNESMEAWWRKERLNLSAQKVAASQGQHWWSAPKECLEYAEIKLKALDELESITTRWSNLPLIVLAGLT